MHKDTHSEYNIVYLRNRKDILEETKTTGKMDYLRKSHRGEPGSRLSKMHTSAVTIKRCETLFDG